MKCFLIFDTTNDVVYSKYNKIFARHINETAVAQELLPPDHDPYSKIGTDTFVHIFSPIITSQRIMACQFGNSYTSIQCEKDPNLAFEEFMGYLFVYIAKEEVPIMKRYLSMCITLVRYICGPDIYQLKYNSKLSAILTDLIDSWNHLHNSDQGMFVEAVEQLFVNQEIGSAAVRITKEATDKLKTAVDFSRLHSLLLVQNKFLGLFSSSTAQTLSSADILFTTILANTCNRRRWDIQLNNVTSESDDEEYYSPSTPDISQTPEAERPSVYSYQVFLAGSDFTPKCIPYIIHVCPISTGINLVCFLETGKHLVASNLYDSFVNLHTLETVQIHRDIETLKPAVDNLDSSIKKLTDNLKKMKGANIEAKYKTLLSKWDAMKKHFTEYIKHKKDESLVKTQAATKIILDILIDLLMLTSRSEDIMENSKKHMKQLTSVVKNELDMYQDFFMAKALRNFTLGSDSLTINKYLEEFPGLVHFLYIDRTNHRITTPTLDFNSDETNNLTKKKIWAMINFSRNHLQEGHLSIMWKDTTFNYAYFLWFEDASGAPLKPTIFPTNASKALPQPGILCGDFYQKLREYCFPKMNPSKIRCYELFCIHLGLVTASCVLEHTRRLSATIWDLKGYPNNPMEI